MAMPVDRPAPLPEPQQERSRATRRRLLDASIEALVECGYAHMSTSEVCRRAGVSQGALFKHFASKAGLLGATVAHLFTELIEDFRRAFSSAAADEDRIAGAIRLLDRAFREPRLLAAFELYVASRTDADLRAALAPVMQHHRENLRSEARALFPESARDNPEFDAFVDVVLAAMQGRALGGLAGRDPHDEAREQLALYRIVRRELAAPATPDGRAGAGRRGERS